MPAPLGTAYVDPMFGMQMSGGSTALKHSYMQYRELGARTRAMFVAAAAAQWNVSATEVKVGQRHRQQRPAPRRFRRTRRRGDAAAGAREGGAEGPEGVPPDRQADDAHRRTPTASRGAKAFGIDIRLPGMKTVGPGPCAGVRRQGRDLRRQQGHGREGRRDVLQDRRPGPGRAGGGGGRRRLLAGEARPRRAGGAVEQRPASRRSTAPQQLASTANWRGSRDCRRRRSRTPSRTRRSPVRRARIVAEYVFPYLAHSAMEPMNCTIDFDGDRCRLMATRRRCTASTPAPSLPCWASSPRR